jgi:hypothetical protein
VGFQLDRVEALSYHWDQLKKLVAVGSSKTGKANINQSLVIDIILAAIAGNLVQNVDGAMTTDKKAPPLTATLKLLGLPSKSGGKRLKRAIQTWKALLVSKGVSRNVKWLIILKRQWKGHQKILPVVKEALVTWIQSHDNVVTSPIYNETIRVKEPGSAKKMTRAKALLEISVQELHNLLVAPVDLGGFPQSRDADGKILVSDTTLRQIIKRDLPQLHRMSLRHKQMCGCKICISMHFIQKSLNVFCQRFVRTLMEAATLQSTKEIQTYKDTVLPNGKSARKAKTCH